MQNEFPTPGQAISTFGILETCIEAATEFPRAIRLNGKNCTLGRRGSPPLPTGATC